MLLSVDSVGTNAIIIPAQAPVFELIHWDDLNARLVNRLSTIFPTRFNNNNMALDN